MNWDLIEGDWKQLAGKVKQKWGNITDDDMTRLNGKRDELEGVLEARYGYTKDQLKAEIDTWLSSL